MKILNLKLLSLSIAIGFAVGLASCSKSSQNEPEIIPEAAEYELVSMQYLMAENDYIDTLTVNLGDTTIYNYSNAKVTSRFADDYSHLTKSSYFQIADANLLPTDLHLDQFEVHVPSQWIGDGSFSYFTTKLPVSQDSLEVPYGKFWSDSVSINIPARSKIIMDRTVQAQLLTCSFKAVILNKTTGENHEIKGTWKGLLRYDHLNTRLTEHPLATE